MHVELGSDGRGQVEPRPGGAGRIRSGLCTEKNQSNLAFTLPFRELADAFNQRDFKHHHATVHPFTHQQEQPGGGVSLRDTATL